MPSKEEQPQQNQTQQLYDKGPSNFGLEVASPILDVIRCINLTAAGNSAAPTGEGTSEFEPKTTPISIPWQVHRRGNLTHSDVRMALVVHN